MYGRVNQSVPVSDPSPSTLMWVNVYSIDSESVLQGTNTSETVLLYLSSFEQTKILFPEIFKNVTKKRHLDLYQK